MANVSFMVEHPPLHLVVTRRRLETKMQPRLERRHAATGRAQQVALLNQKGFYHVFQCSALFTDRGRDTVDTGRSAFKPFDDGAQQFAVENIEAAAVHLQHLERRFGDSARQTAVAAYLREIA